MKSTHIIAVTLLSLASAAAFAESAPELAARDAANVSARNNYPVVIFKSTRTRAEVVAELEQAQKDGLGGTDSSYPVLKTPSTRTRAEVKENTHRDLIQEAQQSPASISYKSLYSGA